MFKILSTIIFTAVLCSCNATREIAYFQDLTDKSNIQITECNPIRLSSGDKISIIVNCKEPELANMFNLSSYTKRTGDVTGSTIGNQQISDYTIDSNGEIDFPIIGSIKVADLTRQECAEKIKGLLISKELIKNPTVTVEFVNLTISILGEVANPGIYNIKKDHITILDAIGMAGDLTITGKRTNIKVLRTENQMQKSYEIDLCSAREMYNSPAFYLQQNDVVYVEPNNMKMRQSTINGNNIRSSSFWISLASLVASIVMLFTI